MLCTANLHSIPQPQIPPNSNGWSANANPQVCGNFLHFCNLKLFFTFANLNCKLCCYFFLFDKYRRPIVETMLRNSHVNYKPVVNTSKFPSIYSISCFCKFYCTCQQHGRAKMHAGFLFKQNCDRSWITAATMVARVEIWKRSTSPASHFCHAFKLLIAVCLLS